MGKLKSCYNYFYYLQILFLLSIVSFGIYTNAEFYFSKATSSEQTPSYLFKEFPNVTENTFPTKFEITFSLSSFNGMLYTTLDQNVNSLLLVIYNGRVTIFYNLQSKKVKLEALCKCEKKCLDEKVTIEVVIKDKIIFKCHNEQQHELKLDKSNDRRLVKPYIQFPITHVPNQAILYIVNHKQYPFHRPYSNQLIGCIFEVKYNDKVIKMEKAGPDVEEGCPRRCNENNLCNTGQCIETYSKYNVLCDCTTSIYKGLRCNEGYGRGTINITMQLHYSDLKIAYRSDNNVKCVIHRIDGNKKSVLMTMTSNMSQLVLHFQNTDGHQRDITVPNNFNIKKYELIISINENTIGIEILPNNFTELITNRYLLFTKSKMKIACIGIKDLSYKRNGTWNYYVKSNFNETTPRNETVGQLTWVSWTLIGIIIPMFVVIVALLVFTIKYCKIKKNIQRRKINEVKVKRSKRYFEKFGNKKDAFNKDDVDNNAYKSENPLLTNNTIENKSGISQCNEREKVSLNAENIDSTGRNESQLGDDVKGEDDRNVDGSKINTSIITSLEKTAETISESVEIKDIGVCPAKKSTICEENKDNDCNNSIDFNESVKNIPENVTELTEKESKDSSISKLIETAQVESVSQSEVDKNINKQLIKVEINEYFGINEVKSASITLPFSGKDLLNKMNDGTSGLILINGDEEVADDDRFNEEISNLKYVSINRVDEMEYHSKSNETKKCFTIEKENKSLFIKKYLDVPIGNILHEVKILKKLQNHDNIVKFETFGKLEPNFVLVTEFLSKGTLKQHLMKKEIFLRNKVLVDKYLGQLLDVVRYIHGKGIVHGDINCDNILLSNDLKSVKLTGFSQALMTDESNSIPQKEYNDKHDIKQLGLCIIETITGSSPISTEVNNQLNCSIKYPKNNMDKYIIDLIDACIVNDPNSRPSADDLINKYKM